MLSFYSLKKESGGGWGVTKKKNNTEKVNYEDECVVHLVYFHLFSGLEYLNKYAVYAHAIAQLITDYITHLEFIGKMPLIRYT